MSWMIFDQRLYDLAGIVCRAIIYDDTFIGVLPVHRGTSRCLAWPRCPRDWMGQNKGRPFNNIQGEKIESNAFRERDYGPAENLLECYCGTAHHRRAGRKSSRYEDVPLFEFIDENGGGPGVRRAELADDEQPESGR